MRGDRIFEIFGIHSGRQHDVYQGAARTIEEADRKIEELKLREMNGGNWAAQYHNKGFVVRSRVVETDFEFPSLPTPRHKYFVKTSPKPNRPGTWDSTRVAVFRRGHSTDEDQFICEYERSYAMLQTFEPFRQGSRQFALISREYTKSAVLDLASGKVIAEEAETNPPGGGFCPGGFFVPDWWDVNHGSIIPGSKHWSADNEWPTGDFGFVWGCIWGDDSSWKVQFLDLSRVTDGVIARDERFGYVELAASAYQSPCFTLDPDAAKKVGPPPFIRVSKYGGISKVTFAVEMAFDLQSGKTDEWQRLKIANLE
ncbi:MAG TPA: hypothetical protein VK797_20850 [Tepidisphaeraceae bacterium]|jgi:hypothetical protein|nr:hypothetical protein [Tepidisphaeraceae bacterium]